MLAHNSTDKNVLTIVFTEGEGGVYLWTQTLFPYNSLSISKSNIFLLALLMAIVIEASSNDVYN